MLPVSLNDLTCSHIQDLIDSEVSESLTLEYKQQLPAKQSEKMKEMLCDVVAMANAMGGDLVFGIKDRRGVDKQSTGIADSLSGMKVLNEQAEITRLSNCIRDSITPRLPGVAMKVISCPEGDVLVVRIPRSWNKPHMVTFGGGFFGRVPTGRYPMSVEEIRRAFSEQGELREAITQWRAHRAELIEQSKGPVDLSSDVAMLFHVIPTQAFTSGAFTDTWRVPDDQKREVYVVNGNLNQRYNADGFLCYSGAALIQSSKVWAYTQLFRSGIVEYGFSNFYHPVADFSDPMICGQELEKEMVFCYQNVVRRIYRQSGVGNVYVAFSLVGIYGKKIFATPPAWTEPESFIRLNVFTSPEVLVELDKPEEPPFERTLRPLVDTLWQLGGREQTPFRDRTGAWNPFAQY